MKARKIHSVRYNFVMNFVLTATQFLFPLITFPYVSRVLGAVGNGKISFAASVANYFMLVASLGIPTYGIRACAQVRDNKARLSKTAQEIFLINIAVTLLVSVTYLASVALVPKFREDRVLFLINGLNILLNAFGMNWLFQALEQYDYITVRSIAFKLLSVILMFLFVRQAGDYVLYGAIAVLAAVGSYVLNFIRARRLISFRRVGRYDFRRHIKPILILFAQSLAASIYTNLDTVMLGFMKTDADVGYYNAAVKIKGILLSLVTSLGTVLLPRMSFYAKQNRLDDFKRTMLKALNFSCMMAVPLVTYFVMFAGQVIRLLAGVGYEPAIAAMQIITVAIIPCGLTAVLGIQVLTALEREKYVLTSVMCGAVIDLLLNLVLIPQYGAAGAALATVVAEFLVLAVQTVHTKSLLREIWRGFRLPVYGLASAASAAGAFWVKKLQLGHILPVLLVSAVVFFGIYGLVLLVTRESMVLDALAGIKARVWKRRVREDD